MAAEGININEPILGANCEKYATLSVGLDRAIGLPARIVGGYRVPASGLNTDPPAPFNVWNHFWSEIWLDNPPTDFDNWYVFDANDNNIIPDDIKTNSPEAPGVKSSRWDYFKLDDNHDGEINIYQDGNGRYAQRLNGNEGEYIIYYDGDENENIIESHLTNSYSIGQYTEFGIAELEDGDVCIRC